MVLSAVMAFLHHLAAFTVVTTLGVEIALFKPPLTLEQARRLLATDLIFGAAAAALLAIGLLRVFFFEKGPDYYFANAYFHVKLGLFILAALISIYPTVLFRSWRKSVNTGIVPTVPDSKRKRARLCMMLELTAIVGILFCAPFMARGLG